MSEKRLSLFQWEHLKKLRKLPQVLDLRMRPPDRQRARIRLMERDIGLPVRAAVLSVLFYYFFVSNWLDTVIGSTSQAAFDSPQRVVLEIVPPLFLLYLIINAVYAALLLGMDRFALPLLQRLVFVTCIIDTVFFAALTLITEGIDSFLYWAFLVLIVRNTNTVSMPTSARQLFLNLSVAGAYLIAGLVDYQLETWQYNLYDDKSRLNLGLEPPQLPWNEPFLLRLALLILMTLCCYAVQVLIEKQRRAEEEAREYTSRQEQLQAAGRLAAEIAHQLKNPLGIINNAAYTLQKTVKEGKTITQQIRIIREEVERSDRIITELMGYARLSEGQVEKLDITEELDRALDQVFPAAANYEVTVSRDYGAALPALLAQRGHLQEVFVNILQNAREAMNGRGHVELRARYGEDYSIEVTIQDNGPGIPAEKLGKIFEAYFTTKEKGTGLGLAIAKHNTELYNGTIAVASEIGQGTTFTIRLPAKTVMQVRK